MIPFTRMLRAATFFLRGEVFASNDDLAVWRKQLRETMLPYDVTKLSGRELRKYRFASWDDEGPALVPVYLAEHLRPFMATDINGKQQWINPDTVDNDHRFGSVAYGVPFPDDYVFTPSTFLTSSAKKQEEFVRNLGATDFIEVDLPEVQGTPDEVIIYKAVEAAKHSKDGKVVVVEDSIVVIDGVPISDWKFTYKQHVVPGKPFTWQVRFGFVDKGTVYVSMAQVHLRFATGQRVESPDFDPYAEFEGVLLSDVKITGIIPIGYPADWEWQHCDPRQIAFDNFIAAEYHMCLPVSVVKTWEGEYQK